MSNKFLKRFLALLVVVSMLIPYYNGIGIGTGLFADESATVNGVTFTINNAALLGEDTVLTGREFSYSFSYGTYGNGNVSGAKLVLDVGKEFDIIAVTADYNFGTKEIDTNTNTITLPFRNETFDTSRSGNVLLKLRFKPGVTNPGVKSNVKASFIHDGGEIASKDSDVVTSKILDNQVVEVLKEVEHPLSPLKPTLNFPLTYAIYVQTPPVEGGLNLKDVVVSDEIPNAKNVIRSSGFDFTKDGPVPAGIIKTDPPYKSATYRASDETIVVTWDKTTAEVETLVLGEKPSKKFTITYSYKSNPLNQGDTATDTAKLDAFLLNNTPVKKQKSLTVTFDALSVGDVTLFKRNRLGALSPDEYREGQMVIWRLYGMANSANYSLKKMVLTDAFPHNTNIGNHEYTRFSEIEIGRFSHEVPVKVTVTFEDGTTGLWETTTPITDTVKTHKFQDVDEKAPSTSKKVKDVKVEFAPEDKDVIPVGFRQAGDIVLKSRAMKPGENIKNAATVQLFGNDPDPMTKSDSATIKILGAKPFYILEKNLQIPGPFHFGEDIEYIVTIYNHEYATGAIKKFTLIDDVNNKAFKEYEFLGVYDKSPGAVINSINGVPENGAHTAPSIHNTNGDMDYYKYDIDSVIEAGQFIKLKFKVNIKDIAVRYGVKKASAFIVFEDAEDFSSFVTPINDSSNIDNDNATTKYINSDVYVSIAFSGAIRANKWSSSDGGTNFDETDKNANAGSPLKYEVQVKNADSNGPIKNVVVVEKLPKAGELGSTLNPYVLGASQKANILVQPGTPEGQEGNLKIYYTTDDNPNLSRLIDPISNAGTDAPAGWSEELPSDVTKVTHIMYDFHDFIFESGDYAGVKFDLAIPKDSAANDVVANRYIYNAAYPIDLSNDTANNIVWLPFGNNFSNIVKHTILDNNTGVFGDRVWYDKNRNGIQDADESGINGVKVQVYDNNNLVAETVSGKDKSGKDGYYLISKLDVNKTYDVVFKVPTGDDVIFDYPNLKPTLVNEGTDENMDSDVKEDNVNYAEAGYKVYSYSAANATNLKPTQNTEDLDFGLYKDSALEIKVLNDLTHNKVSPDDKGIENLEIIVTNNTDNSQSFTLTQADYNSASKSYKKADIKPGDYSIEIKSVDKNFLYDSTMLVINSQGKPAVPYEEGAAVGDGFPYTRKSNMKVYSGDSIVETVIFKKAKFLLDIYEDDNYSGVKDNGKIDGGMEQGLRKNSDVKIHIIKGTDDSVSQNQGIQTKSDLDAGDYTVKIEIPKKWNYKPTINSNWEKDTAGSTPDVDYYVFKGSGLDNTIPVNPGDAISIKGGFYIPPVVNVNVWEDINGDGVQNELPGAAVKDVEVTLIKVDASTNAETVVEKLNSDDNGFVEFKKDENVPGIYKIKVKKPVDFKNFTAKRADVPNDSNNDVVMVGSGEGESGNFTLVSGSVENDIDAGLYKEIGVSGKVFIENGVPDGAKDPGDDDNSREITFKLYRKKDSSSGDDLSNDYEELSSVTTNDGTYTFPNLSNNLRPGNYLITATGSGLDGYVISPIPTHGPIDNTFVAGNPAISRFVIKSNEKIQNMNLGYYKGIKISGNVFNDKEANNSKDSTDANLDGATVKLLSEDGTTVIMETTSDANGNFSFDNIPAGKYKVKVEKAGFTQSDDTSPVYDMTKAGSEKTDFSLGMYKKVKVSGNVYLDTERDGLSTGNLPFSGIQIQLYENGVKKGTPVTPNGLGKYSFDDLKPGNEYKVELVIPAGKDHYKISPNDVGNDDSIDFDIKQDKFSESKTLLSGEDLSVDVGIYKTLEIKGIVEELASPNNPIKDAVLELLDKNGNPVLDENGNPIKVTTGDDGLYSFKDLKPGVYTIKVTSTYNDGTNTINYPEIIREIDGRDAGGDTGVITKDFKPSKYKVTFEANPKTIIGDGYNTSTLTFTMTDENGDYIADQEVTFDANKDPLGNEIAEVKKGTFEGADPSTPHTITVKTNDYGKAVVTFTSPNLEGYLETQKVEVKAKASLRNGIELEDGIIMTFEPSSIEGRIKDSDGNPKALVPLSIKKVFDSIINLGDNDPRLGTFGAYKLYKDAANNDKLTFEYIGTTDANGDYKIFVPFGKQPADNLKQKYEVKAMVKDHDGNDVEFTQVANVDSFSAGTGTVVKTEKAIAGTIAITGGSYGTDQEVSEAIDKLSLEYVELDQNGDETNKKIIMTIKDKAFSESTGVEKNKTYLRKLYFTLDDNDASTLNDPKILVSQKKITTLDDGDMVIDDILIDPFGTITDSRTNQPIEGATVTLYFEDGTKVDLPSTSLALSNNENPQKSNTLGNYSWMVFPNKKYYIIAEKPGYYRYDSRNDGGYKDNSATLTKGLIEVGDAVVKWDFKMTRIEIDGGQDNPQDNNTTIVPPTDIPTDDTPKADIVRGVQQEISTDKMISFVGENVVVKVDYVNNGDETINKAWLKVNIPSGTKVIDEKNGKIEDKFIYFQVENFKPGDKLSSSFVITAEEALPKGSLYKFESIILSDDRKNMLSNYSHTFIKVYPLDEEIVFPSYIYGRPDGGFHPGDFVTRAEIAAILVRNTEKLPDMSKAKEFNDVQKDRWFYEEVSKASAYGYFNGDANGNFRPDAPITREELARVVANYFGIDASSESQVSKKFSDLDGSFAAKDIEVIARYGMIKGYPGGVFKPKNNMIRTETVSLFNKLLYRYATPDVENSFYDMPKSHWAYGDVESSFRGFKLKKTSEQLTITAFEKENPYYKKN